MMSHQLRPMRRKTINVVHHRSVVRNRLPRKAQRLSHNFRLPFRTCRSNAISPRHCRRQSRLLISIRHKIQQTLHVVEQETTAKIRLSPHSHLSREIDLSHHALHLPIFLSLIKKIDAQAWHNRPTITMFLPIHGKRIEMFSIKIHHREEHIHPSLTQPPLRVLVHRISRIPTKRLMKRKISIFPNRRARHLHPRAHTSHRFSHFAHRSRHILATPLCLRLSVSIERICFAVVKRNLLFGIANIVQVNTIYLIVFHNLLRHRSNVFSRTWSARIHHPLVTSAHAQVGTARRKRLFAQLFCQSRRTDGISHQVSVQLHAATMRFFHRKSQHIIRRCHSWSARESTIPRFIVRSISRCGAQTRLEENRVDACPLQLIKRLAQ